MYKVSVKDISDFQGEKMVLVHGKGFIPSVGDEITDGVFAWKVVKRVRLNPPFAGLILNSPNNQLPKIDDELVYIYPPDPGTAPKEVQTPDESELKSRARNPKKDSLDVARVTPISAKQFLVHGYSFMKLEPGMVLQNGDETPTYWTVSSLITSDPPPVPGEIFVMLKGPNLKVDTKLHIKCPKDF